jgi:MFS family permease
MLLIGQLAGPFVVQVMHRPAADMALIVAPAGVGLVGMSVLIPRISNSVERLLLTRIGFVALALGFVSLPVSQWLAQRVDPQHGPQSNLMVWLTIALMLLLGAAMACVNIPTQTIMQERAPTSGRARVLALQFMLYNVGSIPILLISGLVSERLGLQPFIVWISLALLLFCLWGARYTRDSPTLA